MSGQEAEVSAAQAPRPVSAPDRIESLDVIRGFALLGILLLNILGFGLHSAGYFNPLIGSGEGSGFATHLNLGVWAGVDVLFEGAMRCLFSMLFGAGVVLFTTGAGTAAGAAGAKSGALHYRRNFWLLAFGLFDAYVLLWSGDILIVYALAGMLLFPLRNTRPARLVAAAAVLIALMSASYALMSYALELGREVAGAGLNAEQLTPGQQQGIGAWEDFAADYAPSEEAYEAELALRRGSYASAFDANVETMVEVLTFVIPVLLIWDALAMMLLGMAIYRLGWLDASRSAGFYVKLMVAGFGVGLATNLYELYLVLASNFDPLHTHAYMRPTYQLGRLGMATGYIGVVMLICRRGWWSGLRRRLAAVGRMALSNYLMHSLICLFLFTGAGFALVGELQRWALYLVVLAIWLLQLVVSPWWLKRHRYGPAEWLWRWLTYGKISRG